MKNIFSLKRDYIFSCEKEYVEVRDGGTDSSKLLGRFCSDTAPSSLTSTGNILYVHFYTDVADPKNGFKATVIPGGKIKKIPELQIAII